MSAGAGAPVGPSAAGGATRFNEELYDQFWNDCPDWIQIARRQFSRH